MDKGTRKNVFARQHYEILAARFREAFTLLMPTTTENANEWARTDELVKMVQRLAIRFKQDYDQFDSGIWFKKCSPDNDVLMITAYDWSYNSGE